MTAYPRAPGAGAPTGLARRARRLPERETERRMLDAAVAMVHRTGLTVSLDHLSFEDIIRDADVSRSAVYRRWPYKDLFFSDLVMELAKDATPVIVAAELDLIHQVVAEHPGWLEAPELRRGLMAELFRRLSLLDFEALYSSPQWRTYLALHATFLSLADGGLRDRVQAALARAERDRMARLTRSWEELAGLFGYRLRAEFGEAGLDSMVTLLSATLRGLVIMALSMPGIASQRSAARPFGAASAGQWSLPALGIAGIAMAFLEPDPEVEWDAARIAEVRSALLSLMLPE
jgi:AcrR family transcriptional regulator